VDVSVGTGADLVIKPLRTVAHAKVGSTQSARIEWANTGNQTAATTVLSLETMAGLDFKERFANCRYAKPFGPLKLVEAVCTVDTPLAPGHALRLSPDIRLGVTSQAWYTLMTAEVMPPGAQARKTTHAASGYTPGTGPKLTAQEVTASAVTSRTSELNPDDNFTELDVTADNHAHYSAAGAAVHVAAGRAVPVTVAMRNSGPALIYDRSGGEGVDALKVTLPKGTTVTKVPAGCSLTDKGVAGHGPYECGSRDAIVQAPGFRAAFTFTVRADTTLVDARGTAALTSFASDMTGKPVTFPWDTSRAGYTAPIVFNGPAATTGSTPPPTAAGGPVPQGSTSAQALANTGGGSHTAVLAGAGAAALALGAGALVVTRRRKAVRH
jgi:LPXTG-motif cell wall-anchored protein